MVWTSAHEDEVRDIYFAESTDEGASYGPNYHVRQDTEGTQQGPAIAYDAAGEIHVLWEDATVPSWDLNILYAASDNAGVSFSEPVRVNDDPPESMSSQQRICTIGLPRGAAAVWMDGREIVTEHVFFAGMVPAAGVATDARWNDAPARVYPNPVLGDTRLCGDRGRIYNAAGRFIRSLVARSGATGCGLHWDGRDQAGRPVRPGTYFLRVRLGDAETTRRVVILR